jgi:hypothetical protein
VRGDRIKWKKTRGVRENVGERMRGIGIECGDPHAYSCSGLRFYVRFSII